MGYTTIVRRTLRKFGMDLHRAQPQVQDFLSYYKIDCVVDVGANSGQFATSIRQSGYHGQIISIEPIQAVYRQLQQAAVGDAGWMTLQCGLAAQTGVMIIHVSEDSGFSSMLNTLQRATDFDVRSHTIRDEEVPVTTLDDIVVQHCKSFNRLFLKMDVQGYEEQVLAGAVNSLARFAGIQTELSIQQLYDGQVSMVESMESLSQHGFSLALCSPVNFQEDGAPVLIELDGIFIHESLKK